MILRNGEQIGYQERKHKRIRRSQGNKSKSKVGRKNRISASAIAFQENPGKRTVRVIFFPFSVQSFSINSAFSCDI